MLKSYLSGAYKALSGFCMSLLDSWRLGMHDSPLLVALYDYTGFAGLGSRYGER